MGKYEFLIKVDKICDYVPILSTITNLVDMAIAKFVFRDGKQTENPYFNYLKAKNERAGWGALIPFVAALRRPSDNPTTDKTHKTAVEVFQPNDAASFREEGGKLSKTGTLMISKEELNSMHKSDFWRSVSDLGVKKLIVKSGDNVITYDTPVLRLLNYIQPEVETLSESFTVKFGNELIVAPKAKLLLCGDWFQQYFDFPVVNNEIEPPSISKKDFLKVLSAVSAGKMRIDSSTLVDVKSIKYLLFPPAVFSLIDNIYGQEAWEKHCGNVGEVPFPPSELTDFLNAPCPLSKSGKTAKETHTVCWEAASVNGEPVTVPLLEKFSQCDWVSDKIRTDAEVNKPIQKGRWVAMYTEGAPLLRSEGRAVHEAYLRDHCKGYVLPTVRQAMICTLLPYESSGKKINIFDREERARYTRCREMIDGTTLVVGVLAPSGGLDVRDTDIDDHGNVGFRPVREF